MEEDVTCRDPIEGKNHERTLTLTCAHTQIKNLNLNFVHTLLTLTRDPEIRLCFTRTSSGPHEDYGN